MDQIRDMGAVGVSVVSMNEAKYPFSTIIVVAMIMMVVGTIAGAAGGAITAREIAGKSTIVYAGAQPTPERPDLRGVKTTPTVGAADEAAPSPEVKGTAVDAGPTPTAAVPIVEAGSNPLAANAVELVGRVNPAVVTVINKQSFTGFYNDGSDLQPAGVGTGFIISQDGYVVTNHHVVEGSNALDVIFDNGDKVEGTLVGADQFTDLAVIKINVAPPAVVPLGDSTILQPGESVIAIGSALGNYTNTVTYGVISGLNRRLELFDGSSAENLIQHDASINPGNSGGPLFNMRGEVVGVNTYGVRRSTDGRAAEGLGFAMSSETVQKIVTVLIAEGRVDRPYMGVNTFPLTTLIAETEGIPLHDGAVVYDVPAGGPADQSGLQRGDVITRINGQAVDRQNQFVNLLYQYKPGDTIQVEVFRLGTNEVRTFDVTLAQRQD